MSHFPPYIEREDPSRGLQRVALNCSPLLPFYEIVLIKRRKGVTHQNNPVMNPIPIMMSTAAENAGRYGVYFFTRSS